MIYSTGSRAIGFNASASNRFAQYQTTNATYYVKLYKKADSRDKLGTPSVALTTNGYNTATLTITPATDEASLIGDYTVTVTPSTGVTASVSGTTVTLTGLTGGTSYTVSVVANPTDTDTYKSSDAGTTTFTTLTKLATPTLDAALAEPTKNSIYLVWDAVTNASSYTLYYKTSAASTWTEVTSITAAITPEYTITGLTAGTNYDIKVKAVGDGTTYADSDESTAITVKTNDDVPNLYVIGGVNGHTDPNWVNTEYVQMTYDENTQKYTASVYFTGRNDGSDDNNNNYFGFSTGTGANMFDADKQYFSATSASGGVPGGTWGVWDEWLGGTMYIKLAGSDSGNQSWRIAKGDYNFTVDLNAKTFIATQLTLAAPTNVAASDTTSTSFKVTWTAVAGASGYKVYVDGTEAADVATTTATLSSGISAANTYSVTVVAYYSQTVSPASTAISVSTKPGNGHLAADGTTVTNDDSADPYAATTTTSFTFSGKSANATQYYSIDGGAATEYTAAFTISSVGAHSITYYSYYNGKVSATATRYVTVTASTVPQGTTTVTTASVKHTSLTVNWTAVSDATGYKLTLSPAPAGGNPGDVGNVLTYAVTGLSAETEYTITVTPYNSVGDGTAATATATTTATPNNVFEKATTIAAGDEVIFVYENGTSSKAMGLQNGNNRAAVDVTVADDKVEADEATEEGESDKVYVFTVEEGTGDNAGQYAFRSNTNDYYLYAPGAASSKQNYLRQQAAAHYWVVDLTTPDIHSATNTIVPFMRYNSSSTIFSCYTTNSGNGQYGVAIYKRSASTLQNQDAPTGVAYSNVAWNGATISWDAVSTADNGYTVTYTATGGESQTLEVEAGTTQATLSLLEDTEYTVTVHANATGTHKVSPESTPAVTFTTGTLPRVTYNKVTAAMLAESDADAYQYIFVAPNDAAVMGGNNDDARVGIAEGVIIDSENDQAKVPDGAAISLFTIEKDGTSYYFYDGTYYLATQSGVKLFSITDKNDATYVATWNIDAANSLITTTHSSGKAIRFNYASNFFKFRLYDTTGQHEAWLYRSQTKIALAAPEVKGVVNGGTYRFANITIGVPTSATSVEYTLTPAGGTATTGTITAETTLPALVAGEGTVAYTLTATALRGDETATTTISFTLNADGESMATIDIPLNASTNAWGNNKKYTEAVSYLAEAADDDVKATIVTTNGDANSGRYFTSNQSWRVYKKGGSLTLSVAPGLQITKAEFVYAEENGASIVAENIAVSAGTYDATTHTWTNTGATRDLRTVTFSPDGRTDYKYINVYYTTSATTAIINAPTIHFSDDSDVPATGKYTEIQSVKFAAHGTSVNANESLQLWYTTDGSDPRSSSTRTQYTSGTVAITQTTDVRVAATFIGADWSAVTTANLALKPAKATVSPASGTRRQAAASGAVTLDVEANGMTNIWLYYTISNDLESNLDPNVKANTSTTTGRVLYAGSPVTISSAWWNENTIIRVRATTDGDGTDDEFPATFSDLTTAKHYVVSDEFDATAATNVGRTAFTANWEALANATGYVLEVYSAKPGPTSGDYTLLNETFDANGHDNEGVAGRDGYFNFDHWTPTPTPITTILTDVSGWEFDETSASTISRAAYECVLIGSGNHNGSAETPALTIPAGTTSLTLTFNVAGYDGTSESQTGIELSTDIGSIGTAESMEYSADVTVNKGAWTATPASYEIYPEGTSGGVTIYNSGANSRFFLDDVKVVAHVTGSGAGTHVTGSPFSINDGDAMSFVVTGLQPNTTYWYRVKGLQNAVEVNCTNWDELVEVTTAQYATLGEEVATGYIDVPVNIAYVDDNGIAYGCASKGEHQITDGNATEYTEEDDYYSDKLEDYDQRDWVALAGLTSPSTLVGKTIVNFAGTQDATKPGYYFNVTTQPAEADITDQSGNDVIAENTYQVRNLIADNGDYNYVRPQIYEYTTKFNAGLKKDGNTWVVIGSTNAGVETIVLDTSLKTPTDEDVTADGEYRDLEGVFVVVEGSRHAPLRSGSADLNNQSYQFLITKVSEVVTGVQTLKTDDVEYRLRGIYNLQGQRVRETVPGQFYIINGKKTMVNSVIRDTDF